MARRLDTAEQAPRLGSPQLGRMAVSDQLAYLETILGLTDALTNASKLEEILSAALDALTVSLRADRAAVLLYRGEGGPKFVAHRGLSERYRSRVEGHSPWPRDARAPAPVMVADVETDPDLAPFRETVREEGIRALGFIPLCGSEGLLGKFMVYFDAPHAFTEAELVMSQAVAGHIAIALERQRTIDELSLYKQIYAQSTDGVVVLDPDGRYLHQNESHRKLLGFSDEELRRTNPAEILGEGAHRDAVDALARTGQFQGQIESRTRGGERRVLSVSAFAVGPKGERPACYAAVKRDVSLERAQQSRLELLATAGARLSSSLDLEETLEEISRLVVPGFADWCLFDLCQDDGTIVRIAPSAQDPKKRAALEKLQAYPLRPGSEQLATEVLRTGEMRHSFGMSHAEIERRSLTKEHAALLVALDPRDILTLPLKSRGRVMGVFTLAYAESGRRYQEGDIQVAQELCRRIVTTLENVRLFRAAQEAVDARDEFLSIASHELKTPLQALVLQLQILQRQSGLPTLDKALRQTHRLTRLVDELLDVSRIVSGKLELEPEAVDLGETVRDITNRMQGAIAESGSSFELDAQPGVVGRWDRMRTEQVVTNLLSNALKYGQGGPIKLTVAAGEGGVAELSVADRGMGIDPSVLPRLFRRFERAPAAKNFGGLGLGLYITRQIVLSHGGDVTVESKPGEGSTFRVKLPR